MISVDDIAALCTIADRQAPFSNRLKRDYIAIQWILDHDSDGTSAPPRILGDAVSPTGNPHRRMSTSPNQSPSRMSSTGDVEQRQRSRTPSPDKRSRASSPTKSATKSFDAPPSGHWLTLRDLDLTLPADSVPSGSVLINSPRSTLVVLRNGFGVADILGVPERQLRNQALLDGATQEAVSMRLAADARRRELRRELLMTQYHKMCQSAPREDVVEAMRDHFFAIIREAKHNVRNAKTLTALVPLPVSSCAVFDDDCVIAVHHAREKAAKELTRHLAQQQRQRQNILDAEENMLMQQRANAGQATSSNLHRDRLMAARKAAAQAKAMESMEKSTKLIQSQRELDEKRVSEILNKRDEIQHRAAEGRELRRLATMMSFEKLAAQRDRVRDAERAMIDQRRDELEAKARFKEMLHHRNVETKLSSLAQRRAELTEAAQIRREQLRQAAEAEQARREAESEQLLLVSEQRSAQIAELKQQRREAKKARAVAKAEHLRATKAVREAQTQARLEALDTAHEEKMKLLDQAEVERRRQILVQNERMALIRQERAEEQARAKSVDEFKYVGYVAVNLHKSAWLERETQRRNKLTLAVRQEREAIVRSRDEMQLELQRMENTERRRLELEFR